MVSNANKTQAIKKIRFYPRWTLFLLDKWLKKMSKNGWHLVSYGFCIYVFEKGKAIEKEYFSYSCDRVGEGKFSILLRYPHLARRYGVQKKKSKLNKNNSLKGHVIVEVDTQKIDVECDVGYRELRHDRNKLYALVTLRNIGAILVVFLSLFLIQLIIRR